MTYFGFFGLVLTSNFQLAPEKPTKTKFEQYQNPDQTSTFVSGHHLQL